MNVEDVFLSQRIFSLRPPLDQHHFGHRQVLSGDSRTEILLMLDDGPGDLSGIVAREVLQEVSTDFVYSVKSGEDAPEQRHRRNKRFRYRLLIECARDVTIPRQGAGTIGGIHQFCLSNGFDTFF